MYAKAWSDTSKQGKEVDVILCPPSFGAATPHEQSRYWGYTCQYHYRHSLMLLADYPDNSSLEPARLPRGRVSM